MEITEILPCIETMINNARVATNIRYHICWWKGELALLPACHTADEHEVFLCKRGYTFIEGLTNQQWDNLLYKIIQFQKGLSQCHQHPKQLPTSKPKNC